MFGHKRAISTDGRNMIHYNDNDPCRNVLQRPQPPFRCVQHHTKSQQIIGYFSLTRALVVVFLTVWGEWCGFEYSAQVPRVRRSITDIRHQELLAERIQPWRINLNDLFIGCWDDASPPYASFIQYTVRYNSKANKLFFHKVNPILKTIFIIRSGSNMIILSALWILIYPLPTPPYCFMVT